VIDMRGSKLTHIANGAVRSDAKTRWPKALAAIGARADCEVFDTYRPDCAAVEQ
jgi:Holliday junction resolvasome RuvABC endonuclease subunit